MGTAVAPELGRATRPLVPDRARLLGGRLLAGSRLALGARWHRLGVGATCVAATAFLASRLGAWQPHEDEVVAAFVSSRPVGEVLDIVLGERGGAPLHFLLAHAAGGGEPGLLTLRAISLASTAVALVVLAALVARLTDRLTSLVATVLAAASWMVLYHGLYGRMYGLFLLTSLLAFALVHEALERETWRAWSAFALAGFLAAATHTYGALVLGACAVYALAWCLGRRCGWRRPAVAFTAVALAGVPLWLSSLVLADRFDVGLGGGGRLAGRDTVLDLLKRSVSDMVAGWRAALAATCVLAVIGLIVLARRRPEAAVLAAAAVAVPTVALLVTRFGPTSAQASRHLIFVLPFVLLLVATGVVALARAVPRFGHVPLVLGVAGLAGASLAWGVTRTPELYTGEGQERAAARAQAEDWLADNLVATDIVLGYDQLLPGMRARGGLREPLVVSRADPGLLLSRLQELPEPLGRGVWVLDASDPGNPERRLEIADHSPGEDFETWRFGPFMIVRTLEPTGTPGGFLRATGWVQRLGVRLRLSDSVLNYVVARAAYWQLRRAP